MMLDICNNSGPLPLLFSPSELSNLNFYYFVISPVSKLRLQTWFMSLPVRYDPAVRVGGGDTNLSEILRNVLFPVCVVL